MSIMIDGRYYEDSKVRIYKSKPVEKEVVELRSDTVEFLKEWAGMIHSKIGEEECFGLITLEGAMELHYGYFIIKGVKGEFYGCHPEVFHKTYEEII